MGTFCSLSPKEPLDQSSQFESRVVSVTGTPTQNMKIMPILCEVLEFRADIENNSGSCQVNTDKKAPG